MSDETKTDTPARGTRRIRIIRSVQIAGEHVDEGEIFEVSRAVAAHLIGDGSAEPLDPDEKPSTVNRMEHATNADPAPRRVSGPPAKVKK